MHSDKPREKKGWEDVVWKKHRYNERTILKSGSYLNCYCPACEVSLIRDNMVHLDTVSAEGIEGWIEFSPYLNVFERKSSIKLPEGVEVLDLRCPDCGASLKVAGRTCALGDSHVACVMVGISNMRVPLYFCMREGCHWHQIDPEDEHKIILDDSMEW